jgi:carbamoyl-phosphate synthase large subunit
MPPRILVTGTGGTGVGASVLQALLTGPGRWETVAVDAEPFSWGLYAADLHAVVPHASDPGYLAAIQEIVTQLGVEAVIPGTEAETVLLAEHRDEAGAPVIANAAALMPLMRDKNQAQAKLAELGLPVIPSYPWEQCWEAAAEFGYPLVVKPTLETSGSRGVHLVTSVKELDALDAFIRAQPGLVVQPYLGDADSEYTAGVVSGHRGNVIGSIVMRRKLTGLSLLSAKGGAAVSTGFSQGFIVSYPALRDFCEDLAKRLGSTGPLNLQIREHHGQFHVFEIHPRFSFSTSIRAAAGFSEPDMALRDVLLGEDVACPDYRTGVAAIRVFDHILVPAGDML